MPEFSISKVIDVIALRVGTCLHPGFCVQVSATSQTEKRTSDEAELGFQAEVRWKLQGYGAVEYHSRMLSCSSIPDSK